MAVIEIVTDIHAPIERCFDLARSIDLHSASLGHTEEQAICGTTTGLIELGEEVTWLAQHFLVRQKLTSKLTAFDRPHYFRDSMVQGAFRRFDHDHYFSRNESITTLRDVFDFEAPYGLIGRLIDRFILSKYMRQILRLRNAELKRVAESTDEWKRYIPSEEGARV